MAGGIAKRRELGVEDKLNVIVCENLPHAPEQLRVLVAERLEAENQVGALEGVGFVAAVIARMSPVPTADQRSADPSLIVAESYKVLPVDGEALVPPIPKVVGMEPAVPFEAYVARKLYVHNASHAMLGYLGHIHGHLFGYEALQDPWVRDLLLRALTESKQALKVQYHLEPVALQEHIDYLLLRFANRALGDPISRLCRDPLRKLASEDRLVGAARLAERSGVVPEALAWGIAAACAYDEPNDPEACSLQKTVAQQGLATFLTQVSGLQPDERLSILVRERYDWLRAQRSTH
jgi:mannitol-1-phosphate 5-dehydrogenase